ncbi:MAG: N-acetyl-gamma-glutamyl-phosphate reductase [bacterium]|nr:N-acetyl-gamma-glutamyl-phosphate reductase [bacterium]MDT8396852.1 N-acetyl-gamma-glutamyl-phosphate reductase [bacterium]
MIRVGIVGATGYTGMELVRILDAHPGARVCYATSRRWSGKRLSEAVGHLAGAPEIVLSVFHPAEAIEAAELFFVCLPHGEAMETVGQLREADAMVVDLSADFRLADPALYEMWYGEHTRKGLLPQAVYGMPELHREKITGARLVANPGCYPTSVLLGVVPLLESGTVHSEGIVADSKSGVTGAGREPKPNLHFPEVAGNFSAYNIAGHHRHISEMEQELRRVAGGEVKLTFTPHLLPVNRGILSTIYARPVSKPDERKVVNLFAERYQDEPFVRVRGSDQPLPGLADVRGTNMCIIAPRVDSRTGTVVVISCIDNLVKGAAGQAVQNMNLITGQDEVTGLSHLPLHP